MQLTASDLAGAAEIVCRNLPSLEQELNQADAKLGDGDTGGMLSRVVSAIAAQKIDPSADLGEVFIRYARAAATSTGSSLGTLIAAGLLAMGQKTTGRNALSADELGPLLLVASDAMLKRGGAKLGDKTAIDALSAIGLAISGIQDLQVMGGKAVEAGRAALDEFRALPNKIGRARMYGEKTVGLDDPGMLAVVRLAETICGNRD